MTMPATLLLAATSMNVKGKQSFLVQFPPYCALRPHSIHCFTKRDKFTPIFYTSNSVTSSTRSLLSHKKNQNQENSSLKSPFDVLANTVSSVLKGLKKLAMAAVLLGLLLMYDPNSTLAASGCRMSGTQSSSRSYSVARTSSIPSSTLGFSSSIGFGIGVHEIYVRPVVGFRMGGGSSFFLILVGLMAFTLVSRLFLDQSEGSVLSATKKITVLKLQVGLLGMGRSLQSDLNRIAQVADTSTSEGLNYVLTETTLALLRHPEYCISTCSSVDIKRGMEDWEKHFNQLSMEERGKFDEETLVNVNNIKRQSTRSQRANGFSNEYLVITILAAAEGEHKLPSINGSGDLKEALQNLGSIPSSRLLAVEVLWTPQNENDTLSERELLEDYPFLRPL